MLLGLLQETGEAQLPRHSPADPYLERAGCGRGAAMVAMADAGPQRQNIVWEWNSGPLRRLTPDERAVANRCPGSSTVAEGSLSTPRPAAGML
jgi:hypothetical protein